MEFTLIIEALVDIKHKGKAEKYAARLFPNLPFTNAGRYLENDHQWEFRVQHDCDFTDDKSALWETMTYFSGLHPQWTIAGPNDPKYEIVISGGYESHDSALTWLRYELWRGHGQDGIARS